jgi:hypothetical protein
MTDIGVDRPSTASLIGDAIKQSTALFSTEIQLVRLEATEKLVGALVAVASIGAAAVFMIVALIFLLQALVEFLVEIGWAPFVASLAIGGGIGILALIAMVVAARSLSSARLKPQRTLRQVRETTDAVKEIVS